MTGREIYVSVDVEASGPLPGEHSMLSMGACVVSDTSQTFYLELKPLNDNYTEEAIAVAGLSMEKLKVTGMNPPDAMIAFEAWIREVSGDRQPVLVALNAPFDWRFIEYYFLKFLGRNPFGISGIDIKAFYMGKFGVLWCETDKETIKRRVGSTKVHTHNALDDALAQADMFQKLLEHKGGGKKP